MMSRIAYVLIIYSMYRAWFESNGNIYVVIFELSTVPAAYFISKYCYILNINQAKKYCLLSFILSLIQFLIWLYFRNNLDIGSTHCFPLSIVFFIITYTAIKIMEKTQNQTDSAIEKWKNIKENEIYFKK